VTISGTTSGSPIRPLTRSWPANRPRAMPSAARVATVVTSSVAVVATTSELRNARMMSSLPSTTPYQRNEKPVQIVACWLALNE
jgi:hypothetical protein